MFGIIRNIREYVSSRVDLFQLEAVEKVALIYSSHLSFTVLWTFFAFFLLFGSIAAAFALGELYGQMYIGFMWIAAFYLFCTILFFLFRKVLLQKPFMNSIIKAIFENDSQTPD